MPADYGLWQTATELEQTAYEQIFEDFVDTHAFHESQEQMQNVYDSYLEQPCTDASEFQSRKALVQHLLEQGVYKAGARKIRNVDHENNDNGSLSAYIAADSFTCSFQDAGETSVLVQVSMARIQQEDPPRINSELIAKELLVSAERAVFNDCSAEIQRVSTDYHRLSGHVSPPLYRTDFPPVNNC